jgi:heme O synthase-like polyprenyltransferase
MSKNPFLNALAASLYISFIGTCMYYGPKFVTKVDNVIFPIVFISVFTLSAAVMGFVFFYEPIQLYLENKKKEGVKLFLQSLGFFALITILLVASLFLKIP